jgi:uncharacterized coiled-coil protein SlyX
VRILKSLTILCVLSMFPTGIFAQNLGDRLKYLEETLKQQQQTIDQQQKTIEQLESRVKQTQPAAAPKGADTDQKVPSSKVQEQMKELNEKVDKVVEAQRKVLPSEFNPSIGLVGETVFSYRSRNSDETGSDRPGGFDVFQRSVELNAAASVDPFAKAYVVVNASADSATGESTLGVEEAAIQTESLPWNLGLKAGRFFGEFGRLAYIHDHELPFVNRPLVLDQYIGGESRTDGVQLNWLVPSEHYVSLTVGAGDQFGGDQPPNNVDGFRHGSGLNYWGRLSTYFDLTPNISFEPGISGLWNPSTIDRGGAFLQPDGSSLTERERRLFGLDMVLSYKPLRNNQFKSLTWGTEVLYSDSRYDVDTAGVPTSRTVGALGLYSYLAYKFHRQWTTGFLFDWVEDAQNEHAQTFAYSPYITWALSHWNQLRLQYTYTDHNAESEEAGLRPDHAVYLQWAWIIGSHSHGWQQR